ncbi:MAG: MFS transporter [Bacilli bacterium]|nr:MFS transporter [Bacilli bacterium]
MALHDTYEGSIVPKRTKAFYSGIAPFRDACYTLVSMFLITFIQYSGILTKGIPVADQAAMFIAMYGVISALVIGYRIFDALNDPFMGVLIEKCHFKSGKYKPWILLGGVTNTIVVLALFCAPSIFPWLHGWAYVAWFAVFYLLWGITFTMNDIAYWGMLPSLTSEERQRTQITTIMTICCSLGQFVVAGVAPMISGSFGYGVYPIIAIICGVLFMASQIIGFFGIKEHKRDLEAEAKAEQPKFRDMFAVLKGNDQLRVMTIVLFAYYLGSGILNALGLNYFYFAVDFSNGSGMMTIFTVMYALGIIVSQSLFPLLSKKFSRMKLLGYCTIGIIAGYVLFYLYGLPLGGGAYISANPSNYWLYLAPLCLIGVLIFFSQGLFYMNLLIMMTNTIEYNEWKLGERKEATIFSIRPLTTKFASALQQGVLYIFLLVASLSPIIT